MSKRFKIYSLTLITLGRLTLDIYSKSMTENANFSEQIFAETQ